MMSPIVRSLAFLLAAVVPAWAVSAEAQIRGCTPAKDPEVVIEPRLAELGKDYSKSSRALSSVPGRAPLPAGSSGGRVLGLALAQFGERQQMSVSTQTLANGSVCASVASVRVTFGFESRRVFVARELPPGSCIYNEVQSHEMKHVRADEELLRRYLPRVDERLRVELRRMSPMRAANGQQAVGAIRNRIEQLLRGMLDEFTREHDRVQAQIDTVDEYRRLSASCGGELSRYLPGAGSRM